MIDMAYPLTIIAVVLGTIYEPGGWGAFPTVAVHPANNSMMVVSNPAQSSVNLVEIHMVIQILQPPPGNAHRADGVAVVSVTYSRRC